MTKYWKPEDEVVFRHVEGGVIRYAAPYRVVEDSSVRSVLYLPRYSVVYSMKGNRLAPCQWDASVLRIIQPGCWYSLLFFWDADARQPLHWYVNLEEPAKRCSMGFESRDLVLDVLISVDGLEFAWKDEAEFAEAVDLGRISAPEAAAVRAVAEDVISDARMSRGLFSENWHEWTPTEDWSAVLPDDWWHVEGYTPSEFEPGYELYDDDEHVDGSVEFARRVRREKAS